MSKTYLRFTENNDWEGETWHVFVPLETENKSAERLQAVCKRAEKAGACCPGDFQNPLGVYCNHRVYSEDAVESLLEEDDEDCTYMSKYMVTEALKEKVLSDAEALDFITLMRDEDWEQIRLNYKMSLFR